MFAFAAVCSGAPDGIHHCDAHRRESGEFIRDGGYHSYLWGEDARGEPIYHNDCKLTYYEQYCNFVCRYCGTPQEGIRKHSHTNRIVHSISHNDLGVR